MVDVVEIKIWGQLVGAVAWDDQEQLATSSTILRLSQKVGI